MATMDLSALSWDELRTEAKSRGVKTHSKKRPQIEAEMNGEQATDANLSHTETPTETPEETIARLQAELATAQSAAPENITESSPTGPNYWGMTQTQLKTLLQSCGGYDPTRDDGSQASMVGQLQAADFRRGLAPCPKDQPVTITGQRGVITSLSKKTTNSTTSPVRDVVFLMDQDGNQAFTVHRVGRRTPDGPVLMDMHANADRVINLFNQGG